MVWQHIVHKHVVLSAGRSTSSAPCQYLKFIFLYSATTYINFAFTANIYSFVFFAATLPDYS
jgi:hypothetical protein